jgi:hypothetical protein
MTREGVSNDNDDDILGFVCCIALCCEGWDRGHERGIGLG